MIYDSLLTTSLLQVVNRLGLFQVDRSNLLSTSLLQLFQQVVTSLQVTN